MGWEESKPVKPLTRLVAVPTEVVEVTFVPPTPSAPIRWSGVTKVCQMSTVEEAVEWVRIYGIEWLRRNSVKEDNLARVASIGYDERVSMVMMFDDEKQMVFRFGVQCVTITEWVLDDDAHDASPFVGDAADTTKCEDGDGDEAVDHTGPFAMPTPPPKRKDVAPPPSPPCISDEET